MGMISRLRERGEKFIARRLPGRSLALSLSPPWRRTPLCELRVEALTEPQGDGERIRLRAHLHVRLSDDSAQDLNTWVDVRASNAALDEGSSALVPERLQSLGITPSATRPVQTWAGSLGGARPGYAMLTLMQLDKDRLPAPLRAALGPKPFQLTATLVNVVEKA